MLMWLRKQPVLWELSNEDWALFKKEQPTLAHRFVELVLKVRPNKPLPSSPLSEVLSAFKPDYDALRSACSRY